jgi:hypothetical protein
MSRKKKDSENIRVAIRCRNLLPPELERGEKQAVNLDLANRSVIVSHPVGDPDKWTFDAVFNNTFSQRDIFVQEVQPLCDAVLGGFNATVFAYGQSGSGKTHTMTGDVLSGDPAKYGMMPQTVSYVFEQVKQQTTSTRQFKIKVSYVELYNGKSRDLLATKQVTLEIKQNLAKNFYVKGAEVIEVQSWDECMTLFNAGTLRRQTAETGLNATSSRSHALFMLTIEQLDFEADPSAPIAMISKMNVVDLAGSEKLSKTGATGETMHEGCNINLSLSALATVIDKLVKGEKHIPYRGSPLTQLLKDSLGGNSKTVLFANVGPSDRNTSETISTLRFADTAKQIKNKPTKNLDPKDAKIQDLMDQIEELKRRCGGGGDLEAEDRLRERIEQLEVQNDELNQAGNKDTILMEEENKRLQAEAAAAATKLAAGQAEVAAISQAKSVMEANMKQDLDAAVELQAVAMNFLKRICTEEQIAQIRAKFPGDMEHSPDGQTWDVREIQLYLEGFTDLYEDWRQNVSTADDVAQQVLRARQDVENAMGHQLQALEFEKNELVRQREDDQKHRGADADLGTQIKVDFNNAKEENAKLREKVERDQEKFKKKLDKMREEGKKVMEDADGVRSELSIRDRELEKLKKMLEDPSRQRRFGIDGGGGGGGGGGGEGGGQELEDAKLGKKAAEAKVREINLLLRRKGICVAPNMGAPPPPGADGDDAQSLADNIQNEAFVLANAEDDGSLDNDLVGQMQQQLRVQHRLHELRHAQQRKLDDLVRKYELLKTGNVTALAQSDATVSDETMMQKIREAVAAKEDEVAGTTAELEKTIDKLVKKQKKSMRNSMEGRGSRIYPRRPLIQDR